MKTQLRFAAQIMVASAIYIQMATSFAATTIDPTNRYAYGANLGWINWVGDTNNGAVIGDYVCSGYIYSANVGWINLGSGSPANQIQYQNNSATDFGVNNDGLGNLSGYAYGANIGWITFEQTYGKPNVNLRTGVLSGYVWSANCGWISLSDAVAYVQTDTISPGALDSNGLPIAWELTYFGHTGVDPNADTGPRWRIQLPGNTSQAQTPPIRTASYASPMACFLPAEPTQPWSGTACPRAFIILRRPQSESHELDGQWLRANLT